MEGLRIFTLHAPSWLPRGSDWTDEYVIGRVISVDPTPSAPRGALHFWSREAKTKKRGELSGGFHCVSFDDIVEVQGTPSAPRPTQREIHVEKRTERRAARTEARRKRRRKR